MTGTTGPTIEDVSQERLEARIREVAKRLFSDQTFDDLEECGFSLTSHDNVNIIRRESLIRQQRGVPST